MYIPSLFVLLSINIVIYSNNSNLTANKWQKVSE